jgi:hypothetical protein
MSNFQYVVEIKATPARVWATLLDVEQWPQWTSSVTSVKRMDLGPLTLGSRTRIVQPKLSPCVWKVTSLDEPKRIFAWTARTFGVKIVAYHQVEQLSNGGSRVTLFLHYAGLLGAFTARLMRNLNWDYLQREGNGLKKRCETLISWPAANQ